MIVKTSLTKKLPFVEYCNDSFLAVLRRNGNLHATLLDEKDRVCDLALLEDELVFLVICGGPSVPNLREQLVRIGLGGPKCRFLFMHDASSGGSATLSAAGNGQGGGDATQHGIIR
jgi:hypothetical protein